MSQGERLCEGVAQLGVALQGRGSAVGGGTLGGVAPRGVALQRVWLRRDLWDPAGVTRDFLLLPPSVLPLLSCQSSLLGPGGKAAQPLGLGFRTGQPASPQQDG